MRLAWTSMPINMRSKARMMRTHVGGRRTASPRMRLITPSRQCIICWPKLQNNFRLFEFVVDHLDPARRTVPWRPNFAAQAAAKEREKIRPRECSRGASGVQSCVARLSNARRVGGRCVASPSGAPPQQTQSNTHPCKGPPPYHHRMATTTQPPPPPFYRPITTLPPHGRRHDTARPPPDRLIDIEEPTRLYF